MTEIIVVIFMFMHRDIRTYIDLAATRVAVRIYIYMVIYEGSSYKGNTTLVRGYLLRGVNHPGKTSCRKTYKIGSTSSKLSCLGEVLPICLLVSSVVQLALQLVVLSVCATSSELGCRNSSCFCCDTYCFYF